MAETMQELLIRISARIDDLTAKMDAAKGQITGIADHTKNKSKEMSGGWLDVTKAIAAWEIVVEGSTEVLKQWVEEAVRFDAEMGNLKMATGASGSELKTYSEIARVAGLQLGISANDTAAAMTILAREGINSAEAIGAVLTPSLNLARAANIDTASATRLVNDTLKNFSLSLHDSGKVADIFANTIAKSSLTTSDLEIMLKKSGATARAYGVDVSSLTALFKAFDDINVDSTRAGMAYKTAMENLTKAFDQNGNASGRAGKILEAHGVTASKLAELMHDPIKMLQEFSNLGLSSADALELFGKRGGQVFANLLSSSKVLDEAAKGMQNMTSAAKMAEDRMGEWENMINRAKTGLAAMGNVLAKDIMGALNGFATAIKWVSDHLGALTVGIEKSGAALFGVFAPLKQLADHWIHAATTSKTAQEAMEKSGGKLQEVYKGVATAAEDVGDIFRQDEEKAKAAAEKMAEVMYQFHERIFAMGEKGVQDRQQQINAEIEMWRKKGVDETNLEKLKNELIKKGNKEVTDDAYKKLKESSAWEKASNAERVAMLNSWRENSIKNNEAIKVSNADLAEYQKKTAAQVMSVYDSVLMAPMDEGFKELFKGIKEGNMDIGKAAETVAKASGKSILEALAKQADANVAVTITAAASQGGIWGLAANAGAIALATAEALAVHALAASFAEGGIISKPTLAMVGDRPEGPEVVMGIDQLSDMLKPKTTSSGSMNAAPESGVAVPAGAQVTLNYNHQPMFSTASPSESRRAGMEIIQMLQQFGFTPAKA